MPILGGTIEQISHLPLARVYAAYHAAMMRNGHEMNYPAVIQARKKNAWRWMKETIKSANSAPIKGVANLD